jgi:hypothetical protein
VDPESGSGSGRSSIILPDLDPDNAIFISESVTSTHFLFLLRQSWSGEGRERHLHQVPRVETIWRHFPGHKHPHHQTSHQPQVWCETEPIHDKNTVILRNSLHKHLTGSKLNAVLSR